MRTAIPFLSLIMLVFAAVPSIAQEKGGAPDSLVAGLYKAHDAEKSPFFQNKDRKLVDRYFAKELADLIWNDAQTSEGEVGAIDFDPLYNAQDTEIKKFAVSKAQIEGGKAAVPVTFMNFEEKQRITFHLVQKEGVWKIRDIDYGEGTTLLKLLKEAGGN